MKIIKADSAGQPSELRTSTFTGEVWMHAILPAADGTVVNNVFFAPRARTHWHYHESGQLLRVVSGQGLICSAGHRPRILEVGDTVWVSPGERHWHGGGADTCLLHTAVSLGRTTWLDPVSDDEYTTPPDTGASTTPGSSGAALAPEGPS
jgi:quercetin dioxygenase-like cupin family protein